MLTHLASRRTISMETLLIVAVGEVEDVAGHQLDGLDHGHGWTVGRL